MNHHANLPWPQVERRFREFTALRHALKHAQLSTALPPCWDDISRARSVTGRHKLAPEVPAASLVLTTPKLLHKPLILHPPPLAPALVASHTVIRGRNP